MKKLLIILIITYLSVTINSLALAEKKENLLKIGVLLPLSGEFQTIGQSFLNAIQLAADQIENDNILIYPKDNKGNALDTYRAAKKFEELGIKIVIGPVFHKNLERLNEINSITFISLTNKTQKIPKNTIAFGININSQIDSLKNFFNKKEITKTLVLTPRNAFTNQIKIVENSEMKFKKIFFYDPNPRKITGEIERLTNYRERKKDLERRIKILEKSDLPKHQYELKQLEQRHTLGKVNFDSALVMDFGERLKSVLTSFTFSDVSSKDVSFFTLNQWFDKSLFYESALENLHFPSVNLENLKKFEKKYTDIFDKEPNEVSILAYDALGLIYYCWLKNNFEFKSEHLYSKEGFKGLHGEFYIKNNISRQILNIYKISNKKFVKVN